MQIVIEIYVNQCHQTSWSLGLRNPSICPYKTSDTPSIRGIVPFELSSSRHLESASHPVKGVEFSGTNVQVPGVDEPDFVKTDCTRVFAIANRRLLYVKINADGFDSKIIASIAIRLTLMKCVLIQSLILSSSFYQTYEPVPPLLSSRRELYSYVESRPIIVLYRICVPETRNTQIADTAYIQCLYISPRSVHNVARIMDISAQC